MKLQIISAGYQSMINTGRFSTNRVRINDVPLSFPHSRGFNVALLNGRDASLKLTQTFDTWGSYGQANLLIDFLNQNLKNDDILIIFILDEASKYKTLELQEKLTSLGSSNIRHVGWWCPWIFCKYNGNVLIDESGTSQSILYREIYINLPVEQEQKEAERQALEAAKETEKRTAERERAHQQQITASLASKLAAEQREQAAYLQQVKAQQEAEALRQQQLIAQEEAEISRQLQIKAELREQSTHRQQITGSLEDQLNQIETNHSQLTQIIEQIAGTITWLKSSENNISEEEINTLERDITQLKVVLPRNITIFPEARQLQQESKNIENVMLI